MDHTRVDEEAMWTETIPRMNPLMSGIVFQLILLFNLTCLRGERGRLRALVFHLFSMAERRGWDCTWDQPVIGHRPSSKSRLSVNARRRPVSVKPLGGMEGMPCVSGRQDQRLLHITAPQETREEQPCGLRFRLVRNTHHETLIHAGAAAVHLFVNQVKT